MRKRVTLITGAGGEIGHGLIEHFARAGGRDLVAIDLRPLEESLARHCAATIAGSILDESMLRRLVTEFEIHEIYHLAALLSTRSEYAPGEAHRVNVEGTLVLLELAQEQARWHGSDVKFLFPSSIAAYGLPDRRTKDGTNRVRETEFNFPSTMYGCNKLYCEHLGRYFTLHFQQLAAGQRKSGVDFRSLRFPGLISAVTKPSGGTSDYGPEMLHAAAERKPYACFVDEGARLPFMAMPDAIRALTLLAEAAPERLTQRVYNVGAFSVTAGEIRDQAMRAFPQAEISFRRDEKRAAIVDSWPGDVEDTPARRDWGWRPDYDFERAIADYLLPGVRKLYGLGT